MWVLKFAFLELDPCSIMVPEMYVLISSVPIDRVDRAQAGYEYNITFYSSCRHINECFADMIRTVI